MPFYPASAQLGNENVILRARARQHSVREFPGPLSIKSVIEGSVSWRIGAREVVVDESSFLVLNEGEPYSMSIDSPAAVETCCAFFEPGFVERTHGAILSPALDDAPPRPIEFPAGLQPRDARILPRLQTIAGAQSQLGMDEQFTLLARDLLLLQQEVRRQMERLPAARASTRADVFKRLNRGREFLHASFDQSVTLEQISRAACLSAYHFHRLFRQTFGESPHQYLTRLRLERARHLLMRNERPVVEICEQVGFSSLGTFHTLFRRRFGVTPAGFRAAAK